MAIDPSNWGGVNVSSNPKKTTATFKIRDDGSMVEESYQEYSDDSAGSRMQKVQEARAKRLGLK